MLLDASRRLRLKAKPDSAHSSTSAIELVRHAGTRFALFLHSTWREGTGNTTRKRVRTEVPTRHAVTLTISVQLGTRTNNN
jgi:hypothetical protein